MTDVSKTIRTDLATLVIKKAFIAMGILPFLLLVSVVFFGALEPRFLSPENIFNVTRQSTYLVIIAMGKMLVLITGNFDLSVGSNVALVSITTTIVMSGILTADPGAVAYAITAGIAAGLAVGIVIGMINGFGVAVLKVNSFIMTLGMLSMAYGVALTITGGLPVYGLPKEFRQIFAYAQVGGIPAPVLFAALLFLVLFFMLNWTPLGRYLYAIGSNRRAARLSGVHTTFYLFLAHVLCALIAAFGGILMTARVGTGEAGLGENLPLTVLTACVIGGVSLFGGIGRISGVVLGAFFIALLTNGMNLIQVSSYVQIIVIGAALITAVFADQIRLRFVGQIRDD